MDRILFLFDIDGTMIDSTKVDDSCFIETFQELYSIDLKGANWADYTDVTDRGLSEDIIAQHENRSVTKEELKGVEGHFFEKFKDTLNTTPNIIRSTNGIVDFLDDVTDQGIYTAIATGAWRRLADFKLNAAQIPYLPFTLASSNDARSRRSIMNIAIARARYEFHGDFDRMVYFGDGIWDARVCAEMDIPMIGIDIHGEGRLENTDVLGVFQDFSDRASIFNLIGI